MRLFPLTETKWGPLQVDRHPGQGEGEGNDALSPSTESGVTISRWNEGADVDFNAEFDSDVEPPPSDDDEMNDDTQQVMEEWMELFKDGKKMAVVKGKVKGKVAPKREQDWASVQSHGSQTAAPLSVSPQRGLNPASKSNSEVSSSPGIKVQVKENRQVNPLRHNAPPHCDTPTHQEAPPHHDTSSHQDTPPRHDTPSHQDTPPRHDMSSHQDRPPCHDALHHHSSHYPEESARRVPSPRHGSAPYIQPRWATPPSDPPSTTLPTKAGSRPHQKHQISLSPWQQKAPPKLQSATQSASGSMAEKRSGVPHVMGNPPVSMTTATVAASADHTHLTPHHKVTPERVTVGGAGRPVLNVPPPSSSKQRQLVRVLRKEYEDKAPRSTKPAGRHATIDSAATRSGAGTRLSTEQQSGGRKGGMAPEPPQLTSQKAASASQPQLEGVPGASYLELAGLKEKQQEVTTPIVAAQVSWQWCVCVCMRMWCVCVCTCAWCVCVCVCV